MARVGSMLLVEPGSPPISGAVFYLNEAAKKDAFEVVDGTWAVEIRNGSRWVVARGGAETSYEEARNRSFSIAQRGLDFFSITGVSDRAIVNAEDEHLCWWVEPTGVVLRYVNQMILRFSVSGNATLTNAAGNPLPPTAPPARTWNESFRYFRLSQVTDDLFDAYRNLFLALESLLSTITPPQFLGNSRRGIPQYEKEGVWLERAFRDAEANGLITLSNFAAPGVADPVKDVIQDIFEAKRTALFHAKQNRTVFLPHDAGQRVSVTESLVRLSRIYLELVRTHFQTHRGASSLSNHAFQAMDVSGYIVNVTDDDTPLLESDVSINREGRQWVALATREAIELNVPYLKNIIGAASAAHVVGLDGISQIAIATTDGTPVGFEMLNDKLTLEGTERFEVLIRVRLVNREAKKFYGM